MSSATRPSPRFLAVAAGSTVLALAVGGYALTQVGGAPEASAAVALPSSLTGGAGAATASPSATPSLAVVTHRARNPFAPLVKADPSASATPTGVATPSATPSPAAPAAGTGSTGGTGGTAGTDGTGGTSPGAAPSASPSASPSAPATVVVTLMSVKPDDSSAVFSVGGTRSTVAPGAVFAGDYTLVRLEGGSCGTVQHAKAFFDICAGSSVTVPVAAGS
ncbi:hypothetical protein CLV35_1460 [Motilibacter peucedani]|uniref:Uncharacterized protein n=1 Tax=Motilibacter peucedani TaxID=598650 RepID=A0A420XSA0_9ACTN|nr:hypothetical protein [Motilibacter peucedani]RKS77762.1 hypothetical protein CLV35_1460 [Motilibacter peucedani]